MTNASQHSLFNHPVDKEFAFSKVKGHESVKPALDIAAAGGHNLLVL